MTESNDPDRKAPLKLSPGKLELKKTVETGQVRQSFSHGRSKVVTVEVRKKRTFATGAGGVLHEVKDGPRPPEFEPMVPPVALQEAGEAVAVHPPLHDLTLGEKATRVRALQDAMRAEEESRRRAADEELRRSLDEEARIERGRKSRPRPKRPLPSKRRRPKPRKPRRPRRPSRRRRFRQPARLRPPRLRLRLRPRPRRRLRPPRRAPRRPPRKTRKRTAASGPAVPPRTSRCRWSSGPSRAVAKAS